MTTTAPTPKKGFRSEFTTMAVTMLVSEEEHKLKLGTYLVNAPLPGAPDIKVARIVLASDAVHIFAHKKEASQGLRLELPATMVQIAVQIVRRAPWMTEQDQYTDPIEQIDEVMDITGQRWQRGKEAPSIPNAPSSAFIERILLDPLNDQVRVYATPTRGSADKVGAWDPLIARIPDICLVFVLMRPMAVRHVVYRSAVTDWLDLAKDIEEEEQTEREELENDDPDDVDPAVEQMLQHAVPIPPMPSSPEAAVLPPNGAPPSDPV